MALSNDEIENHVHVIVNTFTKSKLTYNELEAIKESATELVVNILQNFNDLACAANNQGSI